MTAARDQPPLIVCASDNEDPSWVWCSEHLPSGRYRWRFFDATSPSWIEQKVTRPRLTRYHAALGAAVASRRGPAPVVVSHQPRVTSATALALRSVRSSSRHVAFTFNFTELPGPRGQRVMRASFPSVDRFYTFSTFEKELYTSTFDLDPDRVRMLPMGFDLRPTPPAGPGSITCDPPYVAAVGGEGRDYATLMEAMRRLPDIRLEVVARPRNVEGLAIPSNVRVHTDIPIEEAHRILRGAELTVLPLLHSEVPCGHVTMVTAMHMAKAQVVTRSRGVDDYVAHEVNALLASPGDPDDLASQILRVWDDDVLRAELAEAGRRFGATHCTEQQVADVFQAYLDELGV